MKTIALGAAPLELRFRIGEERFSIERYGLGESPWLNPDSDSALFAVYADGQRHDATTLRFTGFLLDDTTTGIHHLIASFLGNHFEVEHHIQSYENTALIEQWQIIRSVSQTDITITRLDSFSLDIPDGMYELLAFTSDWGQEFEPVRAPLTDAMTLETRSGRASKGQHPWFALFSEHGTALSGSVAWSGNWVCRFELLSGGGYRLSGGLHDWKFARGLLPGASMESAHTVLALGEDLNHVSQQYAQVGRRWWYPRTRPSASLPVEWNHWWSYEDADINENVFRGNVEAAAELGIEICTLDAGWFGTDSAGAEWDLYRGDWDTVNARRFPNGIRALADATHARGMKFGLWCEIEGLGAKAALNRTHPEFAVQRDGAALGYVCFGNPDAVEWGYDALSRLIQEYACDWIKLDFNVDPGAGCNRTDHGHGIGDGLYEHYLGYYRLLERIRRDFPNVVLENCSSGGLRTDLGILKRTDVTFLSDPDYPVHNLQVFWGATTMLAPDACLHWSFSEWRPGNGPPQQNFNPRDPQLQPHQIDFYTRTGMLGAFGFSQKLQDLPAWITRRLEEHIAVYQQHVRRFVRDGDLYRLTDQPRRSGQGERWCAFQYRLADEHLVFVFRLPGAEPSRAIRLHHLQSDQLYQIEHLTPDSGNMESAQGDTLMKTGLEISHLPEEGSLLLWLR